MTDTAGNGNKVTLTFLVTTSFADIDALLARYGTAGTIPAATVTSLRASLASAKASNDGGNQPAAISRPRGVRQPGPQRRRPTRRPATCWSPTPRTSPARSAASRTPPLPADLGVTSERYPGQPRHPYVHAGDAGAQRQRDVQGPRDRQPHGPTSAIRRSRTRR